MIRGRSLGLAPYGRRNKNFVLVSILTVAAVYDRRRSVSATSSAVIDRRYRKRGYQGPQSVDKRCRRSHGRVERLAMDGPLVSRYLTLALGSQSLDASRTFILLSTTGVSHGMRSRATAGRCRPPRSEERRVGKECESWCT